MTSVARTAWRFAAGTLAALVILLAVVVGAFRLVLGQVPGYRDQITAWLGERAHVDIDVAELDARFRQYGPELVFEKMMVRSPDGVLLASARRGSVSMDVFESLRTGRFAAGRITIEGPELALIRKPDGRLRLVGQQAIATPSRATGVDLDALPTGRLSVRDAKLALVDPSSNAPVRVLEGIMLEIERGVRGVQAEGEGVLPAELGGKVSFEAHSDGDGAALEDLHWQFAIVSRELAIAGWRDLLPHDWPAPLAGRAALEVSGAVDAGCLSALSGTLDVTGLSFELPEPATVLPAPAPMEQPPDRPLPAGAKPRLAAEPARPDPARFAAIIPPRSVTYERAITRFAIELAPEGQGRVELSGFELSGPMGDWPASSLKLEWRGTSANEFTAAGRISRLELAPIWPLLAFAPENPAIARLRAADAYGTLSDLTFEARRVDGGDPGFSLKGRLSGVRGRAFEKLPGVAGVSGRIEASEFGGRLDLDTGRVIVDLPRWFLEPLTASAIDGSITWRRMSEGWRILSNEVRIEVAGGALRGSFELTLPSAAAGEPLLDALATVHDLAVAELNHFLPVGRLRPRPAAWLSQALVAGRIEDGELAYNGPIRKDPFRDGDALFTARLPVVGASFAYAAGWPALHDASGEVEFRNRRISGRLARGRIGELSVQSGRFRIPDLRQPVLSVNATGRGELAAALEHVQASPLAERLGPLFARLRADGRAGLELDLKLPLREPRDSHYGVTVAVNGAQATLADQPLVATDLTGALEIEDGALTTEGLDGRLLGGPFHLVAESGPAEAGLRPPTTFVATGQMTAAALAQSFEVGALERLTGATGWQLAGEIAGGPRDAKRRQTYTLTSELTGLAVDLPAPLTKDAETRDALTLDMEFDGEDTLQLRATTGQGRGLARFERADGGWVFDRGALRYDGRSVALPDHAGLRIEGTLDRLDISEWLALRSPTEPPRRPLRETLTAANLRVGRLALWGYELDDVRGVLLRTDAGWQIDVAGPDATGRLVVPFDTQSPTPLIAELESLELAERSETHSVTRARDPRRVPAIAARIGDLTYGKYHLGRLALEAARLPDGLEFRNLSAAGRSFSSELTGTWRVLPDGQRTAINFSLTSDDVEETLGEFGYPNALTGSRGYLQGSLEWRGPPEQDALARASGGLRIEVEDGQVLSVEPGAGRVLGLMSIAALPRRLALDFSDLTDKGLAFDSITGDFELREGTAMTDNLLLRGPAAEVGIAGRTDLATREYDQTAVVTGNLGASLGVAGALAGGPAVGAALLLFSQIFKEPLKGITRGYYRISGPWDDPVVERLITSEGRNEAQVARTRSTDDDEEAVP